MNITAFLKSAPLLLAVSFALGGAHAAHAQEFSFTAPTSSALTVHPGDSITFSGSLHNDQLEHLNAVTIGLNPVNYGGKFTFASPFFADLAIGQTRNFTGTLKISSTATFSPTFFYLDANGIGDSGANYDLTSSNFKVSLAANPVPEASATISLGLLLTGLGLLAACSRKRRATGA